MRWPSFVAIWAYTAGKRYVDHGCSLLAAGISYYVLFSIFPLLIFSVGVIGLLLQNQSLQQDLVDAVMNNIPLTQDQGRDDVTEAIRSVSAASSSAIGLIGLVTMAWAASGMFGAVRRSLNIASSVEVSRPFVQQKLLDLSMVLFFLPFFLASIAATTALRAAEARSSQFWVLGDLADDLGAFWWLASILLPMVFSFLAFTFLYALVPVTRPRPRYVLPGAIIASLLFEFGKLGFSIYLEHFDNYDVVFGSLGAVVAFMFWVYMSAAILLYGAELIAALPVVIDQERQPSLEDARPPVPLSTKVAKILKGFVISPRT
jgi:membrane protein